MITKNKRTYIQGDPAGLNKKKHYIYTLIWVIIVIDRTWKTNVQDFYILN